MGDAGAYTAFSKWALISEIYAMRKSSEGSDSTALQTVAFAYYRVNVGTEGYQ